MNIFTLTESKRTPEVIFNLESSELTFNGISIPEDVQLFYSPLLSWIEVNKSDLSTNSNPLTVKFNFNYFNSVSLKFIVSLLKYLITIKGYDKLHIIWFYDKDDEDMLETAKDISSILNVSFEYSLR
jgi:hypothetical protein